MESTALPKRASPAKLLIPLLIGAAVALGLGIYGNEHDPTGRSIFSLVFTKTINMKAWFATAAGVVALLQVASGLSIYRVVRFPRTTPRWLPVAHRISGTVVFLLVVPVAYHCLWALGFQDYTTRVLITRSGALDRRLLLLRSLCCESRGRRVEEPAAVGAPRCRGPAFQRFRGRLVHGRVLVLQPVWLPVVLSQSAACTKRWPVAVAISKAARRSRGIAVAVCRLAVPS